MLDIRRQWKWNTRYNTENELRELQDPEDSPIPAWYLVFRVLIFLIKHNQYLELMDLTCDSGEGKIHNH